MKSPKADRAVSGASKTISVTPAAGSMPEAEYLRAVGERLRSARKECGLTRRGVEEVTSGRWKAGALGTYERGHRAITVAKLAELAELYGQPVQGFFPDLPIKPSPVADPDVVLDLRRIPTLAATPADPLIRYASTIAAQRQGSDARALTIRVSDLDTLALICSVSPLELTQQLTAAGVLRDDAQVA